MPPNDGRTNQLQRRVQLTALADGDTAVLKALEPMLEASFSDRHVYRETVHAVLLKLMDHVANVDEDRILRSFVGVIDATLRTNYYQTGKQGLLGSCISFKFDSTQIQDLPKPHPYREIFVYSPRVKAFICVLVLWLVVVCAGLIGVKISAQRYSVW